MWRVRSKKKFFITHIIAYTVINVVGKIVYEAINSGGIGEIKVWQIIVSYGIVSLFLGFFFVWILWDWRKGELAEKGKTLNDDGTVTVDEEKE